jgi:hypothetical protein
MELDIKCPDVELGSISSSQSFLIPLTGDIYFDFEISKKWLFSYCGAQFTAVETVEPFREIATFSQVV